MGTPKKETYRGYHIEVGGSDPHGAYEFWHDSYDGAPLETGGPPADHRCGSGVSVEDCQVQIDEMFLDFELDSEGSYQ